MNFNPDPSKQAQEIFFSRKSKKISHPSLQARRNEKDSKRGWAGSLSKNVGQIGYLTTKIVQLRSFKMTRNTS